MKNENILKKIYFTAGICILCLAFILSGCSDSLMDKYYDSKAASDVGHTANIISASPELRGNISEAVKAQGKLKSEEDVIKLIRALEPILKNVAYSGAGKDEMIEFVSVIEKINPLDYSDDVKNYISNLREFMNALYLLGNELSEFKAKFSKYKESENDKFRIELTDTEYFLLISSLREKNRLTDDEIVLTIGGDTSFGTYPQAKSANKFDYVMKNTANNDYTYNFKNCMAFFNTDDFTVLNNEAAISSRTKMVSKAWQIKSDPKFTAIYNISSVEAVNLANNHTKDCFEEGFQDTLNSLTENKIEYFDTDIPLIKNIKGVEIVFLGYSVLRSEASEAAKEKIVEDIKKYKKTDNLVITSIHAGREYSEQPIEYQKDYAYAAIDAGADLIIGSHPHILEGIEKYKDKYILYSIGDFCFGGDPDLESRMTALFRMRIEIETREITMEIIPFYENSDGKEEGYNNFQPTPLFGEEGKIITDYLKKVSEPLTYGVTWYSVFDFDSF